MGQELRQRLNDLTIFQGDGRSVLYDRRSLAIRPLGASAGLLADVLDHADDLADDSPAWDVVAEMFDQYVAASRHNPLEGILPRMQPAAGDSIRNQVAPERYLNKLAINIANDCNLGCTYCYANKGLYGQASRALISEAQIDTIVTRFADRYDYIENVQFMGGEPSMNPGAIRRTGEIFEELVSKGRLRGFPSFTMVSNGLRFTPRFIEAVKRFGAEITISLDGPAEVHDHIRVKRNGSGSYDAVRRSIDQARSEGITIGFEPTFSKRHLDCGIHLIDLCQWFFDEFGVRSLHAPPMSENRYGTEPLALSSEEKMTEFCAVTEWGLDNLFERRTYLMHSFTERLLGSFDKRVPNRSLCPAGNSMFSVSTSGEVSPCWMYTDEKPFALGHVEDDDLLGEGSEKILDETLRRFELHSHPECRACFMQPVCFGCKGGDYHSTGTLHGKTNCDFMRAMVATFIMRVFNRPSIPTTSADYLARPSFGSTIYQSLRPVVETPRPSPAAARRADRIDVGAPAH